MTVWRWVCAALTLAVVALLVTAQRLGPSVAAFVANHPRDLPPAELGLVLGCSPNLGDGRPNLFFRKRILAATELYRAGKVERLLVSGDNGRRGYDEPSAMKEALIQAGVPAAHIGRDFAGFRTLDSVLRAQQVFGARKVIIVSQRFHAERAIYLARAHGLDARGFVAGDVHGPEGAKVRLREVFSRIAAVLDVHIFRTKPRYLGEHIDWRTAT
jgi:SanA protein